MVELVRSWGLLLAGDQSGDRGEDRVEMLPSAEVARQGPPVLQVADAVLDADPLRRMGPRSASCAAGMVEAGKQFRRVNGHLHLP
ncbi:MAG TPA: hypothetical protein VLJ85_08460, partial [Geodermatophilus sp.]|nr:hypothetical protein [Geodermatophilus sp.]